MSTELATKQGGALATPGTPRRGFEEPTAKEDLLIPRASLLQALSPAVIEDPRKYFVGTIINSITKEELPHEFIPIFKFTNWVRFNPRDQKSEGYDQNFAPGAVIWKSSDPADPRVISEGEFGPNGETPLATKFLNFFAYFPGCEMPVVIGFAKTSFKTGKQLLSLCQFTKGDMFSRKYKLGAKQVQNDKGTYFVFTVEPAGMALPEEFAAAESLWMTFASRAKDLKVHEEDPTETFGDEEPGAAG